jgi:predicted DNA-binding protein
MSSNSTTIRVTNHARDTVREISEITGKRQQDVVDEAVEAYRRQILLEKANQAYAALRSDTEAWQAEIDEREAWDATLADGAKET